MKKLSIKFLSVLLSVLMLASVMPSSVYAIAAEDIADGLRTDESVSSDIPLEEVSEASSEVYPLGEDVSKRTENAKYIRMSDGSYYVAMYNSAVHYLDGDVWEEIDNTLASSSASDSDDIAGVATSKGKHTIKFANNSNSSKLVAIKQGNYKISFNLVGANKSKGITVTNPEAHSADATELERLTIVKKAVSSVMYEDILDGVDLEYVVNGNNLKENIIVKNKANAYIYQFDMKLNKLAAEQLDDGTIVLTDEKTGEVVYTITTPYMVDANGKYSDKVTYSLEQVKNKEYRITVTADSEWMNDDTRAFPVTIDPPITSDSNYIEDATVLYCDGDYNYGDSMYNDICLDIEFGYKTNTFFKISSLPPIPRDSIIVQASFATYIESIFYTEGCPYGAVEIHNVWYAWNEDTITGNTQPLNSDILDYQKIAFDNTDPDFKSYIAWDITRAARNWYCGGQNNGVYLEPLEEDIDYSSTYYITLYSSEYPSPELRPVFSLNYRSLIGLEDYYTYQTQSIGRAGTGYFHDYTSNVTLVRNDIVDDNTTTPFTLSHIYNDSFRNIQFSASTSGYIINTADFSNMKIGAGWKLNIQESVVEITMGASPCYVYTDADGTEHYFHIAGENDNTYIDEDGLSLTLTVTDAQSGNYTLTDKQDNQKIFVNNILSKIVDANGNTIKMIYNGENGAPLATGSVLQCIIRYNTGCESQAETVATFSYNADGFLEKITDRIGRETVFTYIDGCLSQITSPDGTVVTYTYDSTKANMLTNAYDNEMNYGVEYEFTQASTASHIRRAIREYSVVEGERVIGEELYSINQLGVEVTYTEKYYARVFFVRTYDGIATTYTFDNMGRTANVYTYDIDGIIYGAETAKYIDSENAKKKNRIEQVGAIGSIAPNLLENHDLESNLYYNWSYLGSANTKTPSADNPRTGNTSLKLDMSQTKGCSYLFYTEEVNTYTLSAYVNVSELVFEEGDSVYMEVTNDRNPHVVTSEKITSNLIPDGEDQWQRISITFDTKESIKWYRFYIYADCSGGVAYVDDTQLEKTSAPSSYNLLGNIDVWNSMFHCTTVKNDDETDTISFVANQLSYYDGSMYNENSFSETLLQVNRSAATTFHLSAWVDTAMTPSAEDRTFSILAQIRYANGETEDVEIPINSDIYGTQFVHGIIVPKKPELMIDDIHLSILWERHLGTATLYNISLIEDSAQTYTYDDEGNLVAVNKTDTSTISTAYDSLDNVIEKEQGNTNFTYTYYGEEDGVSNKHLLKTVTNDGVTMTYTYDSAGNVTGTVVTNIENNNTLSSSTSYINNGTLVGSVEDGNGISVTYGYNSRNLLTSVTNAANVTTQHTYNEQNDREVSAYIEDIVSVNYNYLEGQLASIVRTGYIEDNETPQTQTYSFEYDLFGNTTKISVGDYTLVTYEYEDGYGNLIKTTYGNGNYIENVYDELDRIVEIKVNGETKYKYTYGGDGNLYSVEDVDNDTKTWYNYDSLGRLISSYQTIGEDVNSLYYYTYDDKSRATRLYYTISGTAGGVFEQIYSYAYDDADDTLASLTVQNGSSTNTISYSYDYLKRLSTKSYGNFTQTYSYKMISETRTSTLIDEFKWTMGNTELRYNYTYDELGNIQKIFNDGVEAVNYAYDEQGQLLLEYNTAAQMFYMYHYDTYGNIRDVDIDDFSDGTIDIGNGDHYVYNDPTWLDRLTAFNGVTITYDNAGNPLSYYNGSAYTLTWQNGRELATATKNSVTSSYKYNIDGQRVQKTVGDVVYDYYYADGLLVRQTWGNNYIDFLYDESGVFSFVYNGVQYYYVKNLQGDVVAIANTAGTILVEYVYDAWGDVISVTGTEASTIGAINPIRYRGYYFDTDTEFYYLNSRYYDPEIRRFINADVYVSTGQGFIGYNMYTYCLNNPVIYADYTGEDAASALHTWTTTMWWLTTIDGPVPVGDIVYGAGILILGALSLAGIGATSSTISVPLERVQIKQEVKTEEREKEIAISEVSNAVYYGCSIGPLGELMLLTGPMNFSAAHSWAMNFQTATRNNWGLYTKNSKDAIIMASALSTYAEPLSHGNHGTGYYEHYHTNPHNFTNKIKTYKKFHVWYGYPIY